MALRRVAAATVLALTSSTLVAGPATARPEAERRDGNHFPFVYDSTIAPGMVGMVATPPLPSNADLLTVTVKPQPQASEDEKDVYDVLITRVGQMKSKKERLLTCLRFHAIALQGGHIDERAEFSAENADLALLLLAACLEAAGILGAKTPALTARAAGRRRCDTDGYRLAADLSKTEDGWRIEVDGEPQGTKGSKVKVSCRVKGRTLTYKVRPRKKGKTLRQVVGKRFGIGLELPSDAERGAPVRLRFATR